MIKLSEVSSQYGAPMGRAERHNINDPSREIEFIVERLPLVDGDYDAGGAYWGKTDEDIYCAQAFVSDEYDDWDIDIEMFIRAGSQTEAEETVKKKYPNAKFKEPELTEFLDGYITCALWSTSESDEAGNVTGNLDDNHTINDIAPECMKAMIASCKDFQESEAKNLALAYRRKDYTASSAGHDFWLTRCGHGAGFWDRGLGVVGERLTKAARVYGNVDLYVGDDGKIYGETE